MDTQSAQIQDLKKLSYEQMSFIRELCDRHELSVPEKVYKQYSIGKRILDCFSYQENIKYSGYKTYNEIWRVVIEDTDEYYCAHKLNISIDSVLFMSNLIRLYSTRSIEIEISALEAYALEEDDAFSERLAYQ